MKTEDMIHKIDKLKIDIGKHRNEWNKLKEEIDNIEPTENYGTEVLERAFVDMFASIDHLKFILKG